MAKEKQSSLLKVSRRFFSILIPFWRSRAGLKAGLILLLMWLLIVATRQLTLQETFTHNHVMTALSEKNGVAFWSAARLLFLLYCSAAAMRLLEDFLKQWLHLRWRKWLTEEFLQKYLNDRAFYKLNNDQAKGQLENNPGHSFIDNPDERIQIDIDQFVEQSLTFSAVLISTITGLATFPFVLYKLSSSVFVFECVYSTIGTVAILLVSRKLSNLEFLQLKKDADFRFGLVHARTNAESIVFYEGQKSLRKMLEERLKLLIDNRFSIVKLITGINILQEPYRQAETLTVYALLFPRYFSGSLKLGDVMQGQGLAELMGTDLSRLALYYYPALAKLAAVVNRLGSLQEAILQADTYSQENAIINSYGSVLSLTDVTVKIPETERILSEKLSFTLNPDKNEKGHSIAIVGPSGSGKSSLLRAVCGLWSSGSGKIVRPASTEILFLPQKAYLCPGSMREQLLFPDRAITVTDEELHQVLARVNLATVLQSDRGLDTPANWQEILSPGQQQLLAIARVLISKPQIIIMDEATSALDRDNEIMVYNLIKELKVSFISVVHNKELLAFHDRVLALAGDQTWSLESTATH